MQVLRDMIVVMAEGWPIKKVGDLLVGAMLQRLSAELQIKFFYVEPHYNLNWNKRPEIPILIYICFKDGHYAPHSFEDNFILAIINTIKQKYNLA